MLWGFTPLPGYSVMVARVFWEDLVPVRIWVPRQMCEARMPGAFSGSEGDEVRVRFSAPRLGIVPRVTEGSLVKPRRIIRNYKTVVGEPIEASAWYNAAFIPTFR